jgi:hypothetical protein
MTTGVKAGVMSEHPETYGDEMFTQALDLVDRAILSIHVSRNAASPQAQVVHAREAFDTFTRSLTLLQQCQSPPSESDGWRYWYNEAMSGQKLAQSLMQVEGA